MITHAAKSATADAAASADDVITLKFWDNQQTESGLSQEVLPNGHGITTAAQAELNELAKRLTGRRSKFGIFWLSAPQPYAKPGGHLIGRF